MRRAGGVLWRAARNFWTDGGAHLAATVAFYSILSAGPFVVLLGTLVRALYPEGARAAAMVQLSPYLPAEAAPIVSELAHGLEEDSAVVLVALPGLLWAASAAFLALEYGVNVAFGTVPRRSYWLSRLKAFCGALGMAVVLATTAVVPQVAAFLDRWRARFGVPPLLGPEGRVVSVVLTWAAAFLAFTLFYKGLPRGRVGWRPALQASLAAVLLWEAVRRLFGGIMLRSPAYGLLTGTLAGLVAFLLWIYFGVMVILLGAEIAAVLNGSRGERPRSSRSAA